MSKLCIHCGAELHEQASFCHICATSQVEKRSLALPRTGRIRTLGTVLAVTLLLCFIVSAVLLFPAKEPAASSDPPSPSLPVPDTPSLPPEEPSSSPEPSPELSPDPSPEPSPEPSSEPTEETSSEPSSEPSPSPVVTPSPEPSLEPTRETFFTSDTAEVVYNDGEVSYLLSLAFRSGTATIPASQTELTLLLESGETKSLVSQLYVRRENMGKSAKDEFWPKVSSVEVTVLPQHGGIPPEFEGPFINSDDPLALQTICFDYTLESGINTFVWKLTMKNGDTIRLRHTVSYNPSFSMTFSHEDYSMHTTEELRDLIRHIETAVGNDNTTIILYLPPAVYSGAVTFGGRNYSVIGSTDPYTGVSTTFTDTVTIDYTGPSGKSTTGASFQNITFLGDGSGIGLQVNTRAYCNNCTLKNWETAVKTTDGAMTLNNSTFSGNGIGLEINNPTYFSGYDYEYKNNIFSKNGTAVLITRLGPGGTLSFPGCKFTGNGSDVVNHGDCAVDLSEASFE